MVPETLYPHPSLPSPRAPAVDPWREACAGWTGDPRPPVIWSVAGTDSGGGAGLAADIRAAAAMGVHLCGVVAAVTAQNSLGVQSVHRMDPAAVRQQLQALRSDMPARVIKTGLLASAAAVDVLLAQREDALLVVDPVLGATAGGAAFCDEALLSAYRHQLLPQAALVTPNRAEAERLLGLPPGRHEVPELARRLRRLGAQAVCITGGDDLGQGDALALDWLDSPLASGWLALPRLGGHGASAPGAGAGAMLHHHGSGCTFATAAAAALARGFALPDAVILAKMLTWAALRDGHAAGAGAGPLRPSAGFVADTAAMPVMGFADEAPLNEALLHRWAVALTPPAREDFAEGLYAISDDPAKLSAWAASGQFAHLQLRIKAPDGHGDAAGTASIRAAIDAALAATEGHDVTLWINDHWSSALDAGAGAVHLGQEDWARLTPGQRQDLCDRCGRGQLKTGVSSHSLWELARARALLPTYIACGPVWPTTTKDMPWLPQGLAQLRWWRRMAGRPVVAIGGLLEAAQVQAVQRTGVAAVCLVRAADAWISGDLRGDEAAPARR